jgi:oligosaccharide repeat unit polymerase
MSAVSLGWFVISRKEGEGERSHRASDRLWIGASAGMIVGSIALFLYIAKNTSLYHAVVHGTFRSVDVQPGTGKYFFLSFLLIPGSVAASAVFLRRGDNLAFALAPPVIASAFFFILGGRVRAATPLICALVLVWYWRRSHRDMRTGGPRRPILAAVLGITLPILVLWILYIGQLYRSGSGFGDFRKAASVSEFVRYAKTTELTDAGQTQALALAAEHPGVLRGRTFAGTVLWPLNKLLPIRGRSTGIYLVDSTHKYTYKWGLQPSLAGDAYVNFGAVGLILVPCFFGFLMRFLYAGRTRLNDVVYVVVFVYSMRLYTESIDKWPELMVVTVFAAGLVYVPLAIDNPVIARLRSGRTIGSSFPRK